MNHVLRREEEEHYTAKFILNQLKDMKQKLYQS